MSEDVGAAMTSVDVAIVGAGPAGSSCAIALLRQRPELRVAVVDRDTHPRPKSCGDLISPQSQARLRALGVEVPDGWRPHEHTIAGPSGSGATVRPGDAGSEVWLSTVMVERREFDHGLLRRARELGAVTLEGHRLMRAEPEEHGWRLDLRGTTPQLRAAVLVGADGTSSTVARSIGGSRPAAGAVALRGYAAVTRDGAPWGGTRLDFLPHLLPYYGWAFAAAGDGRCNIGVVRRADDARADTTSMHDVLAAYLDHLRALGLSVGPLAEVVGAPLAIRASDTVVGPRCALVGDAAGLVSPVDGEGISLALASGSRLGRALAGADTASDDSVSARLDEYRAWMLDRVHPGLERARRLAAWLGNPVVAERVLGGDHACLSYAAISGGDSGPIRAAISLG